MSTPLEPMTLDQAIVVVEHARKTWTEGTPPAAGLTIDVVTQAFKIVLDAARIVSLRRKTILRVANELGGIAGELHLPDLVMVMPPAAGSWGEAIAKDWAKQRRATSSPPARRRPSRRRKS